MKKLLRIPWLNRVWAIITGDTWERCSICGRMFRGREGRFYLYLGSGYTGKACVDCADEADRISRQNVAKDDSKAIKFAPIISQMHAASSCMITGIPFDFSDRVEVVDDRKWRYSDCEECGTEDDICEKEE